MQEIDVIFLSYTKDLQYYGLTQRAINTLRELNKQYSFNIIIVETNKNLYDNGFVYENCKVIMPKEEFNYNKFLNIGLNECKNNFVLISNNDVIFTQNSVEEMMCAIENSKAGSASPREPNWFQQQEFNVVGSDFVEGYEIGKHLTGWCLLIKKQTLDVLGKFDENFKFWYQDNDYAECLKRNNIKHVIALKSRVYHVNNFSHSLVANDKLLELTHGLEKTFKEKYGN
jgi:GT2 family glycosyltransferase